MKRKLNLLLLATGLWAALNLLLTGSVVGLLGAVLLLVMVVGIHRGDYPLRKGLCVLLPLYGVVNLIVLAVVLLTHQEANRFALVWLGIYSLGLIFLGWLWHRPGLRDYLRTAPQPEHRESRFHFFHGGWRDL